jgi:hypothetical protein
MATHPAVNKYAADDSRKKNRWRDLAYYGALGLGAAAAGVGGYALLSRRNAAAPVTPPVTPPVTVPVAARDVTSARARLPVIVRDRPPITAAPGVINNPGAAVSAVADAILTRPGRAILNRGIDYAMRQPPPQLATWQPRPQAMYQAELPSWAQSALRRTYGVNDAAITGATVAFGAGLAGQVGALTPGAAKQTAGVAIRTSGNVASKLTGAGKSVAQYGDRLAAAAVAARAAQSANPASLLSRAAGLTRLAGRVFVPLDLARASIELTDTQARAQLARESTGYDVDGTQGARNTLSNRQINELTNPLTYLRVLSPGETALNLERTARTLAPQTPTGRSLFPYLNYAGLNKNTVKRDWSASLKSDRANKGSWRDRRAARLAALTGESEATINRAFAGDYMNPKLTQALNRLRLGEQLELARIRAGGQVPEDYNDRSVVSLAELDAIQNAMRTRNRE